MYKYKVIVEGSLNADGAYYVTAKSRHEACWICERENKIRNSQSGTTYNATRIEHIKVSKYSFKQNTG